MCILEAEVEDLRGAHAHQIAALQYRMKQLENRMRDLENEVGESVFIEGI